MYFAKTHMKFVVTRHASKHRNGPGSVLHVEGTETLVPYRETVTKVLHRYLAGLQSSMSYMNACTLDEYRRNVAFLLLH